MIAKMRDDDASFLASLENSIRRIHCDRDSINKNFNRIQEFERRPEFAGKIWDWFHFYSHPLDILLI
ncbi:unnamed protein product [Blepharisma stoltei]|uniref:Uncharacterized protein n=1 Tax=Blepharisma stoltei TaxID=1481888 RepID=A0AAU9JFN7_9CILI|nr:unnamed protein product [Blepharisma stoltei]